MHLSMRKTSWQYNCCEGQEQGTHRNCSVPAEEGTGTLNEWVGQDHNGMPRSRRRGFGNDEAQNDMAATYSVHEARQGGWQTCLWGPVVCLCNTGRGHGVLDEETEETWK